MPLAAVPEEQAEGEAGAAGAEQQQQQGQEQQAEAEPPFEFAPLPAISEHAGPAVTAGLQGPLAPTLAPASVVASRGKAVFQLTGLTATPLKRGFYQYHDPDSGYVFELGPASPNSAGECSCGRRRVRCCWRACIAGAGCKHALILSSFVFHANLPCPPTRAGSALHPAELAEEGGDERMLCYRPITLGAAATLLPFHFHEEFTFAETQVSIASWAAVRNPPVL